MNNQGHISGTDARTLEDFVNAFQNRTFGRIRGRQQLQTVLAGSIRACAMFQDNIGKCAANIYGQPGPVSHHPSSH
jgi:hypothetical protein